MTICVPEKKLLASESASWPLTITVAGRRVAAHSSNWMRGSTTPGRTIALWYRCRGGAIPRRRGAAVAAVATEAVPETEAHSRRRAIKDFEHLSTTSSTGSVAASWQTSARCHDDRVVSHALKSDTPCVRKNFPYF